MIDPNITFEEFVTKEFRIIVALYREPYLAIKTIGDQDGTIGEAFRNIAHSGGIA
jgi:hypothetical protein